MRNNVLPVKGDTIALSNMKKKKTTSLLPTGSSSGNPRLFPPYVQEDIFMLNDSALPCVTVPVVFRNADYKNTLQQKATKHSALHLN